MTDLTEADVKAIAAKLGIRTRQHYDPVSGEWLTLVDTGGMRRLADASPLGPAAAHAIVNRALQETRR